MRRHHGKRIHRKRTTYPKRFYQGSVTQSIVSDNPRRVQNGTGQQKIKRLYTVIH